MAVSSLESIASSRRRVKENVRIEGLIPSQLREESEVLVEMLNSYYEFMNLYSHFYRIDSVSFFATVVNNVVIFKTEFMDFFFDDELATTKLYDSVGVEINIAGQFISGTDNLPEALTTQDDGDSYGSLYNIVNPGLSAYEFKQLQLVTPIIRYVGDNPTHAVNSLLEQRDIDTIKSSYLAQIQKEIAATIPRALQSDQKILYKNITQFYRERGSEESIRIFFKLLLNDEVEIKYPSEQMLIPSAGRWDPDTESYKQTYDVDGNETGLALTPGKFIDNSGFLSDGMKIQDSFFYQKFSYLIRTGSNIEYWKNAFNKLIHPAGFKFFGEIVLFIYLNQRNSIMPDLQPGLIGVEDIPLILSMFGSMTGPDFKVRYARSIVLGSVKITGGVIEYVEILDKGLGYEFSPIISAFDTSGGFGAFFAGSLDSNGSLITDGVTNQGIPYLSASVGGSGYVPGTTSITATPNANAGGIGSISVNKKLRYKTTPTITFSPPLEETGITATGTPILDGSNRLIGINITNPGSGYIVDPIITVDGEINRLISDPNNEALDIIFKLIIEMNAAYSHKENTSEQWVDLLHFFDPTPMYTFGDYTFNDFDNKQLVMDQTNVGTSIYSYDGNNFVGASDIYDPTNFLDIEYKLANKAI